MRPITAERLKSVIARRKEKGLPTAYQERVLETLRGGKAPVAGKLIVTKTLTPDGNIAVRAHIRRPLKRK